MPGLILIPIMIWISSVPIAWAHGLGSSTGSLLITLGSWFLFVESKTTAVNCVCKAVINPRVLCGDYLFFGRYFTESCRVFAESLMRKKEDVPHCYSCNSLSLKQWKSFRRLPVDEARFGWTPLNSCVYFLFLLISLCDITSTITIWLSRSS